MSVWLLRFPAPMRQSGIPSSSPVDSKLGSSTHYRTERPEHTTPVLASLHHLPVTFCIDFKISPLTLKSLNPGSCTFLLDLLTGILWQAYFQPPSLQIQQLEPIHSNLPVETAAAGCISVRLIDCDVLLLLIALFELIW